MKKLGLLLAAGFTIATLSACPGKSYEITWKNWDDSVLRVDSVKEGATPDYGAVPTRAEDAKYTYTFKAWSPDIVEATENATYTAIYTPVDKETKEDWTTEEKAIITKYVDVGVPFYKAFFQVQEPAEEDCVILVSDRVCDNDDIEGFAQALEDDGYLYNSFAVNDDFEYFFASFETIYTFEKRLTDDKGNELCDVAIVNFGLDEEKHLVVYATMYLSFFGEYGNGNSIFPNYSNNQDFLGMFLDQSLGVIAEMYEVDNNFVKPFYYADADHSNCGFGFIEYTARFPWIFGNENGDLTPSFEFMLINYTNADVNETVDLLVDAGYVEQDREQDAVASVFLLANGEDGHYAISVGDLESLKLSDGSTVSCCRINYSYKEAPKTTNAQ